MARHHHGGGRRHHHGSRGGRGYSADVVDFVPEYVDRECTIERLPNGQLVKRCPVSDAMGYNHIGHLKFSDAMGDPPSTSTEVRSPTSTEVRSPTSTSTEAYTQGNFTATVTGGAGPGATSVTINSQPLPQLPYPVNRSRAPKNKVFDGVSDALGFSGPTEAIRPMTEYMNEQNTGAGEFSNATHVGGPATNWFQNQRFAAMTFHHGQDYMTNASAYRKRLPDGSWKWCYPGDEARSLSDTTRPKEAGDILPTLVSADTAKAYIQETDTGYDTLDASISAAVVPPEFSTAWKATFMGWKGFAAAAKASVGFFTAKGVMEQTDRWVETLGKFSIQFHQLAPSSPVPTMPSQPGQGVPDKGAASLLSGTTGLVLAGAVLAGILVFGKVAK